MKTFTKNKRALLAMGMFALCANMGFAQAVWDFTDSSVWEGKTLTTGSYDVSGSTSGKNTKVTFTFDEGAVTYDGGIKITQSGSTSSNCMSMSKALSKGVYVSALVKVEDENAVVNLNSSANKALASGKGKYICISNPCNSGSNNNAFLYATSLAESDSKGITIEKIVRHSTSSETSLEIGETGVVTLYPATVVTMKDASDIHVYIIKEVKNGAAILEEVQAGQAEKTLAGFQGYIIKGTASSTITLSIQRDKAELDTDNMLKGSVAETTVKSDATVSRYFLTSTDGTLSFKKVSTDTEATSAARKAWLEIPVTQTAEKSAKLSLIFPGDGTTGIHSVKKVDAAGSVLYYDLNGVGKTTPSKGINIVNGKKVIMK